MALFDVGNITKMLREAGEGIAKTVSDVAEKIPEIKPEEIVDAIKGATQKESSSSDSDKSDVENTVASSTETAAETEKAMLQKELEEMEKAAESVEIPAPEETVTVEGALRTIYALMAVDGEISPEEEDKFNLLGQELDSAFQKHVDGIIGDFKDMIKEADDPEEYYEIIHDYVSDAIREPKEKNTAVIRGKLLLWDLFVIIYSDNHYSDEERRLLRYICRTLHIDKAIALEMEQTLKTLMTIEEEENWIKTTNRSFKKVENRLNELADRKQTIMQSIYALIAD